MKDLPEVSIVFESPVQKTGVYRYSRSLVNGLQSVGITVHEFPVKFFQPVIFGKPVGGWVTQQFSAYRKKVIGSIVHATSPHVMARRTNVVTIHDLIRHKFPRLYPTLPFDSLYGERVIRRALKTQRVIAVSNHVKSDIVDIFGIDPERVDVVYFNIDSRLYYRSQNNPYPADDKIHLVLLTDFNPRKRLNKILPELAASSEMDLYIIGRTDIWPKQVSYAEQFTKNNKNIHILGYLEFNLLRDYVSASDLFIFHSIDEGIGMPPVEAMACGTNTLVNDIPVFREFLKDNSFYFNEEESLIDAVNKAMKVRHSPESLVKFAGDYSLENTVKQLLESYGKIDKRFLQ